MDVIKDLVHISDEVCYIVFDNYELGYIVVDLELLFVFDRCGNLRVSLLHQDRRGRSWCRKDL